MPEQYWPLVVLVQWFVCLLGGKGTALQKELSFPRRCGTLTALLVLQEKVQ